VGVFFFLRVRHNSCRWFIQKAGKTRKKKNELMNRRAVCVRKRSRKREREEGEEKEGGRV